MLGESEGLSPYFEYRKHFLIRQDLCFDVSKFFGIGKTFSCVQLTQIFMNGDQYVLNKFSITEALPDQSVSFNFLTKQREM